MIKGALSLALLLWLLVWFVALPAAGRPRCSYRGDLPDPGCTPGATLTGSLTRICVPGYARRVRDVSAALKRRVYREYGIAHHRRGTYEVDHLIPLELGGANTLANLWPQPAPGYQEKDRLENASHRAVCAGRRSLAALVRAMARDWHALWVASGRP